MPVGPAPPKHTGCHAIQPELTGSKEKVDIFSLATTGETRESGNLMCSVCFGLKRKSEGIIITLILYSAIPCEDLQARSTACYQHQNPLDDQNSTSTINAYINNMTKSQDATTTTTKNKKKRRRRRGTSTINAYININMTVRKAQNNTVNAYINF